MSNYSREINFVLNGEAAHATIQTHYTILDVLRNTFGLYGARESCGQGLCGCCTVLIDGDAVSGCLCLAASIDGREVTTVENLDADGELDVVQQAFIDCGAFQCGFCTSGFLLMSKRLLAANTNPSDDEIRSYLSGNLCRCAAYPEIIEAVKLAANRMNHHAEREKV